MVQAAEVSLYCVFVFLLKFSDLATLNFHFNAWYYFVSNLSPGSKSDPASFPLQAFTAEWKRGKFQAFIFRLVTVLKARGNELFGPSSLIVGYHRT